VQQVIVELCERVPLLASFDPKGNGSKDAADPTSHLFGTFRCAASQRRDTRRLVKSLCHVRLYEWRRCAMDVSKAFQYRRSAIAGKASFL
jgi:hypothetical protein